jgi:hypothetical protein
MYRNPYREKGRAMLQAELPGAPTECIQVDGPVNSSEVTDHAEKAATVEIPVSSTRQKRKPRRPFPFSEKFGREPRPDNPLFFNPESAVPEFLGVE